jgi:hypothetical protein
MVGARGERIAARAGESRGRGSVRAGGLLEPSMEPSSLETATIQAIIDGSWRVWRV